MMQRARTDKYGTMYLFGTLLLVLLLLISGGCSGEKKQKLKIGDQAPDFTVSDMKGQELHLASWKGNPVILRFWDTECKYCRADTPVFNQYFEQYKDQGLKVVYINTGKEEESVVADFVKDLQIPFPVVMTNGEKVAQLFNVRIVPQTVIINPDQTIIAAILGGVGEAELEELVGKFIK